MPNANRDKGLGFERAVAGYFRAHGLLSAERSVSTGWRTAQRSLADSGDIKGIPGITVQCKNVAKPLVGKALENAMRETEAQRDATGYDIGLLIEKRDGVADVGYSYAWLPLHRLILLSIAEDIGYDAAPVRIELRHIIGDLVVFSKGYGNGRLP